VNFAIDPERCVACLACVRVCPTDAIAVAGEGPKPLVQVVDEACIRCGECFAVCPHDAVMVSGELGRALAIATQGDGVLILSPESAAHFYPATPEQLINACYAAGFRTVTRGIIGDELVAGEYLRLWEEEGWGTLVRSTDPVVVDTIRARYPELIPYLAPVTVPAVAEARYLRGLHGPGLRIVYAGVLLPAHSADLDAAITFADLEQILRVKAIVPQAQPTFFQRVPEEPGSRPRTQDGASLGLICSTTAPPRTCRR